MTYSILLVVEKPDPRITDAGNKWGTFLVYLNQTLERRSKGIQRLAEGTMLISLNNGLQGVSDIVQCIDNQGLNYTYIILTEEIEWHEVSAEG